MESGYLQSVGNNILPLSVAQNLSEAFKEWYFTENTVDNERPIEQCQLCNQEELRYHFEIKNKYTGHTLWVGSKCILKFQISVYEDDELLDSSGAQKKLNGLMKKMRFDSCLKALAKLSKEEDNNIIRNALTFYYKNKYLTPKYAFVVLWRLNSNKIDYSPSFFKVCLKKAKYKIDIREMSSERLQIIWPALSAAQKAAVEKLRK